MPADDTPHPPDELRISLLGGFRVSVGARQIPSAAWKLRRAPLLLKLLALAPGCRMPRDQVIDVLWPDENLRQPGNSLHQVIYAVRHTLDAAGSGEGYLQAHEEMLILAPRRPVWTDVAVFEAAATTARLSRDPAGYRAALDAYPGDLLPDDLYIGWIRRRRDELRQRLLELLSELGALCEETGDYAEAMRYFERGLELDRANEDFHRGMMRLHALTRQPHRARQQYAAMRYTLRDELGVAPTPATERLYRDIIAGNFPPVFDGAIPPSATRGAPHHQLQPGADARLPLPTSLFIGRERARAEIAQLLANSPIVSIVGPGGSGKTRLAIEVCRDLGDAFPDGVWWIELASLSRSSDVAQALASALGLPNQQDAPASDILTAALANLHTLLLLDNCEHLIDQCATLVDGLLRVCPRLRILCASREPLRIPGETLWRLSSLTLPDSALGADAKSILQSEAARLFVDRSRALDPTFALTDQRASLVAQICRRLDGLPLAIELAAARIDTLTLEQIADGLDDCILMLGRGARTAPTRHQTLIAALDWSYNLLSEPERALFRQLAVFVGGCDLEAIESVAPPDGVPATMLDLLAGLVDKSLVVMGQRAGRARYHLLEPIRQYAERWLVKHDERAATMTRFAQWLTNRAEQADRALWGAQHGRAIAWLEAERGNLGALLDWLMRMNVGSDAGVRLIARLWQFWLLRGYFTEGRRRLEQMLARLSGADAGTDADAGKAEMLLHLVGLTMRQGDYGTGLARSAAEEAVAISRRSRATGPTDVSGRTLGMLGVQAYMVGEYDRAEVAFREALELAQRTGSRFSEALAHHHLGVLAWARGEYVVAESRLTESLAHIRATGTADDTASAFLNLAFMPFDADEMTSLSEETWVLLRTFQAPQLRGYILANLGSLARTGGRLEQARAYFDESLAVFRLVGDRAGLGQALGQMGNLARVQGDFESARALLTSSMAMRRAIGERRGIGMTVNNLGVLAIAEGDYTRAAALFERTRAYFTEMTDGSGVEMTYDLLAFLALRQGAYDEAKRLLERRIAQSRARDHGEHEIGRALGQLGLASKATGDVSHARECFAMARDLFRRLGAQRFVSLCQRQIDALSPAVSL